MADLKKSATDVAMHAYEWLETRLGLIKPISDAAIHPTPSNNASWLYVF